MTAEQQFESWFKQATGYEPYPFQTRFACDPTLLQLVDVPTGLGKTAMVVLGWLWRRRFADKQTQKATPRRLVYCLPMRVLVEQTHDNAVLWLHNCELLAGTAEFEEAKDGGKRLRSYTPDPPGSSSANKITVHVLMGGEDEEGWDIHPEREQIIIGTQDMLLSRALNRGYAASRSRWPIQFGLLNTDALWVFDEIQLMGAGLATTAQLEAFRHLLPDKDTEAAKNGHGCRSVWMSATMQRDWLKTVDYASFLDDAPELAFDFEQEIKAGALDEETRKTLESRWKAKKPLAKSEAAIGDAAGLAQEVRNAHKPGTRTIALVNTVKRARALFDALNTAANDHPKKGRKGKKTRDLEKDASAPTTSEPRIVLLHSRFRPEDRKKRVDGALAEIKPGEPGAIVVSTQVIEAGVDISATTLFTELAPWASLIQRFGRCNRRGEDNKADIFWIDVPAEQAAPYAAKDIDKARKQLQRIGEKPEGERDVGLASLAELNIDLPFEHIHVIRRKDLIDLFDTTPDLAGNDIDIDRFVREVEGSDVRVFWRDYGETPSETNDKEAEPAPQREELCPVPIGDELKKFVTEQRRRGKVWRWSFLDKKWEKVDTGKIVPGQVLLVHAEAGGYSTERGWDPDSSDRVDPIVPPRGTKRAAPDATDDDPPSRIGVWQTIAVHAGEVCVELDGIVRALSMTSDEAEALHHAARWHDRGKAHDVFRAALPDGAPDAAEVWAKAAGAWKRYSRRHFRHELASALSVLDPRNDQISDDLRDLIAYLVAAHHGKVRLSIRSLSHEMRPDGHRRFARGIWDDDELPATELGGGVTASAVRLSLEPMELGLCEREPFTGQPSWVERMIRLRDTLDPFRLACLEAVLRAADMRASRAAEQHEADKRNAGASDGRKEVVRD